MKFEKRIRWVFLLVSVFVISVKTDESENVCTTPTCQSEAARVISMIDLTVDPCDNFYDFACGGFIKNTEIPPEKKSISSAGNLVNQLNENLRDLLSEPIKSDEIEPFQNVKKLFQACMNEELVEQRGITPVMNVLNELGGWPVVMGNDWKEENWTWQQAVFDSVKKGFPPGYFIGFRIVPDPRDKEKNLIAIDKADFRLNRDYLLKQMNESLVEAYHSYQVDLAVMFGADRARAEEEMQEVLEFEFEMAAISDESTSFFPIKISRLQPLIKFIDLLGYLNSLLPAEAQLTENDEVNIGDPSYFDSLGHLISKTSKRTLANYIKWRQAFLAVRFMPKEFKNRLQVYTEAMTGKTSADPRWLQCVLTANKYYSVAISSLYVRKHFNADAKKAALDMINDIREEFIGILRETDWMDASTRKGAITKAAKIKTKIGFADEYLDDAKILEFYAQNPAQVSEKEYFESVLSLKVAKAYGEFKVYRDPIEHGKWYEGQPPAKVNAGYYPLENAIGFPAAILQGVFFNPNRPKYMNYGGIGFVVGHEITHGFDDDGSKFDGDGNKRSWWAAKTRMAFMKKVKCIADQYSNYTEPLTNIQVDGEKTQGENIADNGGIKEAYLAYNRWAKDHPEPKLPGLKYTPQQMFWITAGQVWCDVVRIEALKSSMATDEHTVGRFRTIGPLSNRPEFSNDFQCAAGTQMNPENKCQVW